MDKLDTICPVALMGKYPFINEIFFSLDSMSNPGQTSGHFYPLHGT